MNQNKIFSNLNSICDILKFYRNNKAMTIDDVANALNLHRNQIIAVENYKVKDIELISKYCDLFNIELKLSFKIN